LSFKAQLPLRVATHPAGSVIALNGGNAAMAALEDVGVATQSLASPSGAKHYRSAGAAPGCCGEGRGGILERERRRGRDLELPGRALVFVMALRISEDAVLTEALSRGGA
jgi:hypothetical protein